MSTFLGCFHSVRGALTVSKASAGTSCVGHWATVFATRAGTLQLRNSSSDGGNTTDSEETVRGLNIVKGGSDPKVKPREAYPEWLWELLEAKPTLQQLSKKSKEDMTAEELARFTSLSRLQRIKARNAAKGKS
mmetsp:Transcript_3500/g.12615  ORF Transcript_3500/g.12615 Transcript_3500/m.12615 type:complete len:133 (-) Transcript_3500:76-474(-)